MPVARKGLREVGFGFIAVTCWFACGDASAQQSGRPAAAGSPGDAQTAPGGAAVSARGLDPNEASELERNIRRAYEKAVAAVVCIRSERGTFSGTIVNSSGEIATVAHHGLVPKTPVTVVLGSGREVEATVLGRHVWLDVGLVRLDEKGPWPAAALGRSTDLRVDEPCLALGYPGDYQNGQPPLLRLGRVAAPGTGESIRTSCYCVGGDSGGGLFDLQGRLVGICFHVGPHAQYVGVEVFDQLRERLRAAEELQAVEADVKAGADWPENDVQEVYAQSSPSVVRLLSAKDGSAKGAFSGVFAGGPGEILTCVRLDLPPGSKVTAELADGRTVKATLVGLAWNHEAAMFRVDDKGDWPAATPGHSASLRMGDPCLAVGYRGGSVEGKQPSFEPGQVLSPGAGSTVLASCPFVQNQSGWSLFDRRGRLVGICVSLDMEKEWGGTRYVGAEVFARLLERLRAGGDVKDPPGILKPTDEWNNKLNAGRGSVVQILSDGKAIAAGFIVASDGWIVTKQSDLAGHRHIACQLTDGRKLDSQVMAGSQVHDLALMKVDASRLPVLPWAKGPPRVGELVFSVSPNGTAGRFAVVGVTEVRNPASPAYLPVLIENEKSPPVFTGWEPTRLNLELAWHSLRDLRSALKPGDVITHLGDVATPTFKDYYEVLLKEIKASGTVAGERVKITVRRGDETRHMYVPFLSQELPTWGALVPLSLRRDGFPDVFAHDGAVAPLECVSPVLNSMGETIGLNISRAAPEFTYAIPSDVAQQVIAKLRAQVEEGRR